MSSLNAQQRFNFRSTEFRLGVVLFLLLWGYLIIRAFSVFYLHDEIVTKWSYVIHWNPLPSQGDVDANNHFMLSLLAGFFTRLFNSDSMFFIRLGSVLAFPIYFWSVFKLRFLFTQKWNFYALLLALTTTSFLIEYFAFARGYGLALAFLIFSMQQMISYYHSDSKRALIGSVIGWILAVYSSLTLLPLALLAVLFLGANVIRKSWLSRKSKLNGKSRLSGAEVYLWIIPVLLMLVPFAYFIEYSFLLKELGKLYYGGTEGFFASTVHSLTEYIWFTESTWLDVVISLAAGFILVVTIKRFWKTKNFFDPKLLFSLFFFAGIASILLQHWMLDVNYPEDRTALYLVVFFFGALFLAIDEVKLHKAVGMIFTGLFLIFFAVTMNFTHSLQFNAEHLDVEIVQKIPLEVNGTPPTTAGRWNMENELTRELNLPFRVYQNNDSDHDTLADYMVYDPRRRLQIKELYNIIHFDEISSQALLKRKKVLKRAKTFELEHTIISEAEFQNLRIAELEGPMILRCSGQLEEMTNEKEIFIVFSSEDTLNKQQLTYECVPMIRNKKASEAGILEFDFSYAMNALKGANSFAAYVWNQNGEKIQGKIKLEVYKIED